MKTKTPNEQSGHAALAASLAALEKHSTPRPTTLRAWQLVACGLTIFLIAGTCALAQAPTAEMADVVRRMDDMLRKGIVEEDSGQNPATAITQYQAVLTQFAEARETAATALFRMAECYRKQGNRGQAVSAYQRLMQEFPDQMKLVLSSRVILSTTYGMTAPGPTDKAQLARLLTTRTQEQANIREARTRYRATILQEMDLVKEQIALADKRYTAGVGSSEAGRSIRMKLVELQRDLAAFDAGMTSPTTQSHLPPPAGKQ